MELPAPTGAGNGSANGCNGTTLPSNATNGSELEASQLDVEVLPIIRDIFRSVEKDNTDGNQRSKDSLEASQKVMELAKKIEKMREEVYQLPGISTSKGQQMTKLANLRKQLAMKKNLIARYKGLNLKVNGLSAAAAAAARNNSS